MIDGMLNQTAIWKRRTGNDGYGEPVFADPLTIRVRWEAKRRLVRNKKGQEVISEARVFCKEAIEPGDVLRHGEHEWDVITVSEVPGMDGRVWYREAAV